MNAVAELYGTGGLRPLDGEEAYIRGVRLENNIPVVLDSGADMSVLPMKFKNVGLALSKKSVLRDAQGNRMAGVALRQAIVELVDDEGNKACIKETFALSNVAEPLLALGKMLKKGWTVAGQEGGDGVRPQSIPRLPMKAERQVHQLTHWPYEDWCMQCVAARGKADPHRRSAEDELRMEAKSEYPVVSLDYAFTRGLREPTEADKEDLRLYGGDVRGGVALVVTDDWCRSVLALPGKGRAHAKYLAEQIIRYISACGFSTCIVKADAEPASRLLLDILAKARQKLGFKTVVELVGPDDSQGNGMG